MANRQRALFLRTRKEQGILLLQLKELKTAHAALCARALKNTAAQSDIRAQLAGTSGRALTTAGALHQKQHVANRDRQRLQQLSRQYADIEQERTGIEQQLRRLQPLLESTITQLERFGRQ